MQYSHSRVECHISCPYKYKLRYVDKLEVVKDYTPDNALICGNTIHQGAETNLEDALKFYHSNYPIISDKHIEEIIKFEYLIPKIHEILDGVNVYKKEFKISTSRFIGIVDLITKNEDGTVDVFDYKYSNNYEKYMESPQLHLYKYYLEQRGFKVRKLGFIFIPKISIKQKKDESIYEFRLRINEELKNSKIKIAEVKYDANKVIEYLDNIIKITEDEKFEKNPTNYCSWCDYENYCLKGEDYMILPSNKRREINKVEKRVIWIYGAPFSGKTTFANDFPDPLMLNTDGNIKFVDSPFIPIKDEVTVTGRITNRKFAWEVYKEAITELEKKQNDFKTIIVDLLEDTYEHCRLYMYHKLGIEHESDDSFRAWDKVRTEFLSTLKRLMSLDYENIILISHVDTSKDITKKGGDKISKIAPNMNEKISNKVAGMVDIVARTIAEDNYILSFKKSEVIFGGGRLTISSDSIPLEYEELVRVYDEANKGKKEAPKTEAPKEEKTRRRSKKAEETKSENEEIKDSSEVEKIKNASMHGEFSEKEVQVEDKDDTNAENQEIGQDTSPVEEVPKEEKPRRRRRKAE